MEVPAFCKLIPITFAIFYSSKMNYWVQSTNKERELHKGMNNRRQRSLGAILETVYNVEFRKKLGQNLRTKRTIYALNT